VTSASEFNIYYDPHSAHTVFHSPTTKTVIPLDTTNQVSFSMDLLMQLPSQGTRAGDLLHRIVPYAFRAHHQQLGLEGIHLHDAVALMGAIHPELFHMEELHGDVETRGEITSGATVFDRRAFARGQPNMEVATGVDVPAVTDSILRGLRQAGIASV
jgi:purine nucleosidase